MSALAIVLAGAVAAMVPIAVLRPWLGFLAYTWVSLSIPQRVIGGAAADWPLARILAVATVLGLLVTRQRAPLPRARELWLLAGLLAVCVGSTLLTAYQPERAWRELEQYSKVLAMTMVALMLFRERGKLHWWLVVIALSIGSLAVGGAAWAIAMRFSAALYGPPGSIIGDNNTFGFALTMILPLLAFLAAPSQRPWLRPLMLNGCFATLVAIAATRSRGALIGAAVVLPLTLLVRRDRALLGATVLAMVTVLTLTPPAWNQRMATITLTAHRATESGAKRMNSWFVAWQLGLDHPLLGAGFRPFSPAVYEYYLPGYSDYHDAHNVFLQVLAEQGFTGLLLFAALLISVLMRLWPLAVARAAPEWVRPIAQMTLLSLLAYLVGGAFLNMPYFELLYQLIAIALLLDGMARASAAAEPIAAQPLAALLAARLRGR